MKGKKVFTKDEINCLRELIRRRVQAPRSEQMPIRDKMRSIGFYGQYDFGIRNCRETDFEELIRDGRIIVKDDDNKVPIKTLFIVIC